MEVRYTIILNGEKNKLTISSEQKTDCMFEKLITKYKFGIVLISVFIVVNLIAFFFINRYHNYIQQHSVMYAYEKMTDTSSVGGYVYLVHYLDCSDNLITYHKRLERGEDIYLDAIGCDFEIVPYAVPIYILGYEKNSQIAEIYCYYTKRNGAAGHMRGYIYAKNLYSSPPENEKERYGYPYTMEVW